MLAFIVLGFVAALKSFGNHPSACTDFQRLERREGRDSFRFTPGYRPRSLCRPVRPGIAVFGEIEEGSPVGRDRHVPAAVIMEARSPSVAGASSGSRLTPMPFPRAAGTPARLPPGPRIRPPWGHSTGRSARRSHRPDQRCAERRDQHVLVHRQFFPPILSISGGCQRTARGSSAAMSSSVSPHVTADQGRAPSHRKRPRTRPPRSSWAPAHK